jgi:hypothetical protein
MTHFDGNDVLVIDDRGVRLHSVEEVLVEPDRAVVHLRPPFVSCDPDTLGVPDICGCTIHSLRDGRLRWRGPVRLVCI